ncbi:TPA: hypothetical protein ACNGZ6_002143 [Escherichia coli]
MEKYSLEVFTYKYDWVCVGLFDTRDAARNEGQRLLRCWRGARDFVINPVQVHDEVEKNEIRYW